MLVRKLSNEEKNNAIKGITLLSDKEYETSVGVIPMLGKRFWLQSPARFDYPNKKAAAMSALVGVVGANNKISDSFSKADTKQGVRPALLIDNSQLKLRVNEKVVINELLYTVISDTKIVCDSIIGNTAFNSSAAEEKDCVFENSDIKQWLGKWLDNEQKKHEINIKINEITLPSREEITKWSAFIPSENKWYWLRTAGGEQGVADIAGKGNKINGYGDEVDNKNGVRPLICFDTDGFEVMPGAKLIKNDVTYTVISSGVMISDKIVGSTHFCGSKDSEEANDFAKSDVKVWLDDWAGKEFGAEKDSDNGLVSAVLQNADKVLVQETEEAPKDFDENIKEEEKVDVIPDTPVIVIKPQPKEESEAEDANKNGEEKSEAETRKFDEVGAVYVSHADAEPEITEVPAPEQVHEIVDVPAIEEAPESIADAAVEAVSESVVVPESVPESLEIPTVEEVQEDIEIPAAEEIPETVETPATEEQAAESEIKDELAAELSIFSEEELNNQVLSFSGEEHGSEYEKELTAAEVRKIDIALSAEEDYNERIYEIRLKKWEIKCDEIKEQRDALYDSMLDHEYDKIEDEIKSKHGPVIERCQRHIDIIKLKKGDYELQLERLGVLRFKEKKKLRAAIVQCDIETADYEKKLQVLQKAYNEELNEIRPRLEKAEPDIVRRIEEQLPFPDKPVKGQVL
ncbi:MAG: hypothetical protein K6A45_09395 [Lachnospiraceae bacterium]|nr:hypothetical protein [Lachnospiraceae bacterium]